MMYIALQIVGMVVVAIGGQGAIRQLIDLERGGGILEWMPGGWVAHLVVYLILVVAGILLAGWANSQWKRDKASE